MKLFTYRDPYVWLNKYFDVTQVPIVRGEAKVGFV